MDFVTDHSPLVTGAFGRSDTFVAGLEMLPGSIAWHIDCSGIPMDLRPAVDTILHAINEKLPSASPEKPLVVLFTETHTKAAQLWPLPLVAKELSQQGSPATVAFESPHNFWAWAVEKGEMFTVPEELRTEPGWHHDLSGRSALSADLGWMVSHHSPVSRFSTLATLYRLSRMEGSPLRFLFNDAAKADGRLDLNDPLTARTVQAYREENPYLLSRKKAPTPFSPEGIACRNRIMVGEAMAYARQHGRSIILQQNGTNHALGNKRHGFGFKDSLYALFQQAGATVIPVLYAPKEGNSALVGLSQKARAALSQSIILYGLADDSFLRQEEEGCSSWETRESEYAFLGNLQAASGENVQIHEIGDQSLWRCIARYEGEQILDRDSTTKNAPNPCPL